jgi:folate-binding protein YgfZ
MQIMQSFILASSHFDLLRVTGADAGRFLQGQVTCDVSNLTEGNYVYGAACNNKGRVIAPFLLYRQQQDFLLVFEKGLASLFVTVLKKFLPFYKCSLAPDGSLACLGLGGNAMPQWLEAQGWPLPAPGQAEAHTSGWVARMTGEHPQYVLCTDTSVLDTLARQVDSTVVADDGSRWQATSMRNGHFPFAVADSELYTPQELHYEQKQYVSFTKGCYTGQEIVARMHYRGKIKKQFYRVEFPTLSDSTLGHPTLLNEQGGKLAECTKTVHLPEGGAIALVLLPVESAASLHETFTSTGIKVQLQHF